MKFWRVLALMVAFIPDTLLAKAGGEGFFLSPALFYATESRKIETTTTKSEGELNTTIINATFGYALGNGFILGLKYFNEQLDDDDSSDKTEVVVNALGPTVGYSFGNFKLFATMFVLDDPKRVEKIGSKIEYSEGGGTIYDLGYFFDVGSIGIGPQFSFITLDYERREIDGTEDASFKTRRDGRLLPSVALYFAF